MSEEKLSPAERKELEALRAASALRERQEAGIERRQARLRHPRVPL